MKESFFKVAREEMFKSDYCGNARIGCAIYYKGTLLSKGHNTDKTSPLQKKYNKYRFKESGSRYLPDKQHAELTALAKMRWLDIDFGKVEVYIYRELKNGEIAMARPCNSCFHLLKDMGIKNIYYTTDQGYAHEVIKKEN